MRTFILALIAVFAVGVVVSGFALAGQEKGKTEKQPPVSTEEMAAWQKAGTPGPHHKHFADAVGSWKAETKMWMAPGTEPMVEELKAQCELVYDGRYLVEKIEGTMMGMPFKGMSISGYDNLKGKHTLVWMDNMSTSTVYSEGDCSENCAVETHQYTQMDPMTGKDMKVKMVARIIDKNKHVLESYMVGDDGKELKNMEITYTRM